MTPTRSLSASATTTFTMYAVGTALSLLFAWPFDAGARAVGGALPDGAAELTAPGGRYLVEAAVPFLTQYGAVLLAAIAVAAGLGLLLGPWLQMAWLVAIDRGSRIGPSLLAGGRLYPRCVGLRLLLGGVGLAVAALGVGAAVGVALLFHDAPDVRRVDLATALPIALTGATMLPLACVWDLAHARLARGDTDPLEAVVSGVRALRPRAALTFVTYSLVTGSLIVAANAVALLLPSRGDLAIYATLAITQLLWLARAFARAAWLREALERTAR